MAAITFLSPAQRDGVKRLLRKGWIEPWQYRRSVYLFLPRPAHVRRRVAAEHPEVADAWLHQPSRDYHRNPIRVTPSGRLVAGWAGKRKEFAR